MSEFDDLVDGLDENRETRMPKVNGQPLVPGLSEPSGPEEGVVGASAHRPDAAASARRTSPGGSESSAELDAGEVSSEGAAAAAPRTPSRRRSARSAPSPASSSACKAYAPAGTTCKLCGKVHPHQSRTMTQLDAIGLSMNAAQGKIAHEHIRTDFKAPKK